ncbi:acyl-CoA dehydrogenase family protein [Pseudonocardia sp. NPDC049635]|uniref:acyl-CoA dehydrogenase family protein n=1 Tax=Pseudonocardia sp. NPDC049635 TaxID=3155506 RepID=UPI0033CC37C6
MDHPPLTRDEAVAAAAALVPELRAGADAADAARGVPAATISAVREAGLFDLLTPREWGGSELGFDTALLTTAELARGCPSTAWLRAVMGGNTWAVAHMSERARKEVLGTGGLVALQLRISGPPAAPVPGGYALGAMTGRFCSGIDHAEWLLIQVTVAAPDGAEGTGEPHLMLVPAAEVTVVDDWHTVGLRGTGSRGVRLDGVVVPEHRVLPRRELDPLTARGAGPVGPVYAQEFSTIGTVALAGVLVGAARAALDEEFERITEPVAEQRWCARLADVDGAEALLLGAIDELTRADVPGGTPLQRARLRRDTAVAAQRCRAAVNDVFAASGGGAVYDGSALQRLWRDTNAAAQHATFDTTRWFRLYADTARTDKRGTR